MLVPPISPHSSGHGPEHAQQVCWVGGREGGCGLLCWWCIGVEINNIAACQPHTLSTILGGGCVPCLTSCAVLWMVVCILVHPAAGLLACLPELYDCIILHTTNQQPMCCAVLCCVCVVSHQHPPHRLCPPSCPSVFPPRSCSLHSFKQVGFCWGFENRVYACGVQGAPLFGGGVKGLLLLFLCAASARIALQCMAFACRYSTSTAAGAVLLLLPLLQQPQPPTGAHERFKQLLLQQTGTWDEEAAGMLANFKGNK